MEKPSPKQLRLHQCRDANANISMAAFASWCFAFSSSAVMTFNSPCHHHDVFSVTVAPGRTFWPLRPDRLCKVTLSTQHPLYICLHRQQWSNICRPCINDELCRLSSHRTISIRSPPNSLGNGLYTRTTHANTSTHWVNTLVVSFYCDFGTWTWITRCSFNFNDFFANFWYFNGKVQPAFQGESVSRKLCTTSFLYARRIKHHVKLSRRKFSRGNISSRKITASALLLQI